MGRLWLEHSLIARRKATELHNQSYLLHMAVAAARPGQKEAAEAFDKALKALLAD